MMDSHFVQKRMLIDDIEAQIKGVISKVEYAWEYCIKRSSQDRRIQSLKQA